jgi:hypothetical protein
MLRSIERLVPPPMSLASETWMPASRAARQPNRPLPRNRFDDGEWAICAPAAASAARSASSSQMPWAKTLRPWSRPAEA